LLFVAGNKFASASMHLGSFQGFGTGAARICDPANLTSVLKVPAGTGTASR
jgi:hypothetical protein